METKIYNKCIKYTVQNDEVTIVEYRKNHPETKLAIPSEIAGKKVVAIEKSVFSWCENLVEVEIPSSVTTLGEGAFFSCKNLEKAVLPSSITVLTRGVFQICEKLTSISIPNSITKIEDYAFSSSGLVSITIPNSVTFIGEESFRCCQSLEKITIPSSVTYIGGGVFGECKKLRTVEIDAQNTVFSYIGGLLYNKEDKAVLFADKSLSNVHIPDGTQIIKKSTFDNCANLKEITLPNSLTTIEEVAFTSCVSLEKIILPNSLTTIEKYTFYNCSALRTITIPNSVTKIEYSAFNGCRSLEEVVLSSNLECIESSLFYCCTSLKKIDIPKTVTTIERSAFRACTQLQHITLPQTVTKIDKDAFFNSPNIKLTVTENSFAHEYAKENNIAFKIEGQEEEEDECIDNTAEETNTYTGDIDYKIENNEVTILSCSFTSAELDVRPEKIIIPNEIEGFPVTVIAENAYNRVWLGAKDIEIPHSVKTIEKNAFSSFLSLKTITLPDSLIELGEDAFNWKYFTNVEISSTNAVFCIENGMLINKKTKTLFASFGNNKNYVIPDGLVAIGKSAFKEKSMESITIPDSVIRIEDSALDFCKVEQPIQLPSKLEFIGDSTFSGISNVSVDIPDSVIYIGKCAFSRCKNLKKISFPASITVLPERVFAYCSSLESIVLPDSITEIKDFAFDNCKALKNITLPSLLNTINASIFNSCSSIEEIVLPNSIAEIKDSAFSNCTSLKNITFPSSLKTIGAKVFIECISIEKIQLPESITEIKEFAFQGCTSLKNINLPQSLKIIGQGIFSGLPDNLSDSNKKSSIEELLLAESHPVFALYDGVLYNKNTNTAVCSVIDKESYTIVDGTTRIENYAFYSCSKINAIQLPNTLITIGKSAFSYCKKITNIQLPKNLTTIEEQAFYCCKKLANIVLPNTLTSIGERAFSVCSLDSIQIPPKITELRKGILTNNPLKTFKLPSHITSIAEEAFYGSKLESIEIPLSTTCIEDRAFYECKNLKEIIIAKEHPVFMFKNGLLCNKKEKKLLFALAGDIGFDIPEGMLSIADYAFPSNMTRVTIPSTLKYFAPNALFTYGKLRLHICDNEYACNYAKEKNIPFKKMGTSKNPVGFSRFPTSL